MQLSHPSKKVVVLQSNYIPWKGYFDLIHDADVFIFYDDVQYTKNDWRNRNKVKTRDGARWITVPVGIDANRLICEVDIKDSSWQQKHWNTLVHEYSKRPYFAFYRPFFEELYLATQWTNLSVMNQTMTRRIASELLHLTTRFDDSRSYQPQGENQDRLLDLLVKSGATDYISGPAAKSYITPERFAEAGIRLAWKDYSGYPEYAQAHPPFEHGVSILDLLFNTGPQAGAFIWPQRAVDAA
jgi:hypothetical protein